MKKITIENNENKEINIKVFKDKRRSSFRRSFHKLVLETHKRNEIR